MDKTQHAYKNEIEQWQSIAIGLVIMQNVWYLEAAICA